MSYVPDPSTQEQPLNVREVELLIETAGKGLLKNQRALVHFLNRVLRTMHGYRDQMQRLHREMQQSQLSQEHSGAPTTLHPIDSFRYLSEEEKKRVMDRHLEEKYDALQAELRATQAARGEVDRIVNALKFQLAGVLDEPSVPSRVKQQLSQLMTSAEQLPPAATYAPAPGRTTPPAAPPVVQSDTPTPATGPVETGEPALDDMFDEWLDG